jgi:rare lipoprotein A
LKRLLFLCAIVAGCASVPQEAPAPAEPPPTGKGGYYKDDGPHEHPPQDLEAVPDAVPRLEPLHRYANRPYEVFGRAYVPLARLQTFRERGVASWYGRRFHGQRTASGEIYDMYAMTAAHPTLPIPSYVRVTNLANARSVVVRVNDRGPFHRERVIDLSYAAAFKLGLLQAGSAQVELESIIPGGEPPALYVQLGAFGSRDNAESLRARFAAQLAWVKENIEVALAANLWRLRLGPYRSREEARAVAERIESELDLRPLIVAP